MIGPDDRSTNTGGERIAVGRAAHAPQRPPRTRRGPVAAIAVVVLAAAGLARAQEEQYRERQVLDPERDIFVDQPAPTTQPDELGPFRALLAEGQARKARKQLQKWLKANGGHERYYEAELLLGDAYFDLGDFWKAAERYESVAQNTTGELFRRANERTLDVARAFLSGRKRILWRVFRLPAYDDGADLCSRVWERMPGSRLGELALKIRADYLFDKGDKDLAQDEYALLLQQYPNGRYAQYALRRGAESAEGQFPGIKFDAGPLVEAEERYRQFQAQFPGAAERADVEARLAGIREQRAQKDLDVARWYQKTRQLGAAQYYYRLVLKDWPETLAAAEARTALRGLGADVPSADAPPEAEKRP